MFGFIKQWTLHYSKLSFRTSKVGGCCVMTIFVFDKERLHNMAAFENFGPFDSNLVSLKNHSG